MSKRQFYMVFLWSVFVLLLLTGCGRSDRGSQAEAAPAEGAAVASAGDAAAGKELYGLSCIACHGATAEGIPGLGPDLTASEFVTTQSDQALVEFIKKGRMANDPANTTGIAMPPKGGDSALTDADMLNIVAHLRSIQK
jgi:disulfide bond formation protein DsbB